MLHGTGTAVAGPTGATASSTYPTEEDTYSYAPSSAVDGLTDTMWCEHNTEDGDAGNGVSEWLEIDFGSATSISQVAVRTGNSTSDGNFRRANRPLRLQVRLRAPRHRGRPARVP